MATSQMLELTRLLASFSPARADLRKAPWDDYADWSIANGLAPLAAYNLEYRLAGSGAPEWVRDRLLSIYQGSVNDNVMKLVAFKRAVDDLEGRRILLLGGASFADVLYPHVAFRPLPEIKVRVASTDLQPFVGFLGQHRFKKLESSIPEEEGAAIGLTDDHAIVLVYTQVLPDRLAAEEAALVARAQGVKVYGPSVFRPTLEDAILLTCFEQAREGFQVPLITFLDLRELVLGAPSLVSAYTRAPDFHVVRERAKAWRIDRALYASLSILARVFPETEGVVKEAMPQLRGATKAMLDRLVVEPLANLQGMRPLRGMDRLRRLLAGG